MADEHKKEHGAEGGHDDHGGGSHKGGHGGGHAGGHGEHEESGAPEWLISFADNVMLIMAFFVIMLAMNMGPKGGGNSEGDASGGAEERMLDFALAVRDGFNNPVRADSTNPGEQSLVRRLRERTGGEGRPDAPQGRHPDNSSARPGEVSSISASVTFEDGKTDLSASGRATVADMTSKVKDQRWVVEIRGHAGPLETLGNVDRAFALSFERAMNVARAMVAQGARWEQLRVVAAGDKERLVPRTFSRDQDRTNQRVEIIQTQVPVPPDPYSRQSSAGDG